MKKYVKIGKASMVLTGSSTRISTKQPKVSQTKSLLGVGGFGNKGTLPSSNVQIAVKKVSHDSKQGMKEFVAEIISMGRLRHRNLGYVTMVPISKAPMWLELWVILAPELTRTGRATTYTDVFAFGAFMLEVACGRKPIEPRGLPEEEMELVLKLGLLCSHSTPAVRPSMRQVMQFLDGNADLQELPHESTGFGNFTSVEASEILMSIPSSFGMGLTPSSSTNTMLYNGSGISRIS
uniref:Protein kinase domain-containing protein n=1 Tax=Fagus sylvatica TaxID=28930 RepID=A0A2N9ITW4_FAGSY